MSDSNPPNDGDSGSNLIKFPSGKMLDKKETGTEYVVAESGQVPMGDVLDPVDVKQDLRERIKFVKSQPLVKSISEGSEGTMELLLLEVAEEISHLKWERRKASREGKNTSAYTIGRINGLRSLAETLIRKKEADTSDKLDLKSPRMQKLFKIWMQMFYTSMEKSGVSEEVINVVFQQIKADLLAFEQRMEIEVNEV